MTAPDPSFRDQLAMALRGFVPQYDVYEQARTDAEILEDATAAADVLLPLVEAGVQAAANQRAAEERWIHEDCRRFDARKHPCGCGTFFCLDHWVSVIPNPCDQHASALAQPAPHREQE